MSQDLLKVEGLVTQFATRRGLLTAVDRVDFSLAAGETLGLVGESGCGKSVTALSLLGLLPKPLARVAAGRALFAGRDLLALSPAALRKVRGNQISMIFQEPMTSLNPVLPIGFQVMEPLRKHRRLARRAAREAARELLQKVAIPDPARRLADYPHQLSGGMRQRVMIAMALACSPRLMIADEPTTALDVTIQAQILALIKDLQVETGMAVILITHDLGVVAETCRRVLVMYAGRVVESAPVGELFARPAHPYTRGLFDSLPRGRQGLRLNPIPGAVPSLLDLPAGCAFQDRCRLADPACRESPPWRELSPDHGARCWRPEGL